MADRRRESRMQGLTRRELGIAGEGLEALYDDERDGFTHECSSRQDRRSWSILVIRLFWVHSLLYLALLSVAVEAEEGAAIPRYTLTDIYNTLAPNAANAEEGIHPSNGSHTPRKSPSPARPSNPSPSPAPNHPTDNNSTGAPPVSAPTTTATTTATTTSRFNSQEKAGIILASFAALLQVVVVTYLLAKRRQMLGMVCDYDPPERAWENPTFSRA